MKTKIVIATISNARYNKGEVALLKSRIDDLEKIFSNPEFVVLAFDPKVPPDFECKKMKMLESTAPHSFSFSKLFKMFTCLLLSGAYYISRKAGFAKSSIVSREDRLKEYHDSKLIVSTGGDTLCEGTGCLGVFPHLINLLIGILLGKTVIIYAESVGPFNNPLSRLLAKFVFHNCRIIILRENLSRRYLHHLLGDRQNIFVTADSAFLIDPVSQERVNEILRLERIDKSENMIGVSVSRLITKFASPHSNDLEKKYEKFVSEMAKFVDYIIDELKATVVFVPQVVNLERPEYDDRDTSRDIRELAKNKDKIRIVENEYEYDELKGLIGCFDLFIGARFHSVVSSLSMKVPTIILSYSQKSYAVEEMLGLDHVLDIKDFNAETLMEKAIRIWKNRTQEKDELENEIKKMKIAASGSSEILRKELSDEEFGYLLPIPE